MVLGFDLHLRLLDAGALLDRVDEVIGVGLRHCSILFRVTRILFKVNLG